MKVIKLIAVFGIIVTFFSSCEKCVSCSYQAPGYPAYSGDYCSKRTKDIDAFKKSVSTDAQRFGTSAECIDKDK
jgi:hypothetical protein